MKKNVLSLLILLIMIFLLVGCDPPTYYFNADDIVERATKIVLVECENNNPELIKIDDDTIINFDISSVAVIKELEEEKIECFAYDLSTITFHEEDESVNSPLGYAVLIYLEDQEVIVLSCTVVNGTGYGMAAIFTVEGDFIKHIAQFADEPKFKKLLEEYFGI